MTATIIPDTPAPTEGADQGVGLRRSSTERSSVPPSVDALRKLDPRTMYRNPVMFIVEIGSVLTTLIFLRDFGSSTSQENVFAGLVSLWLWFTVLFANFAEAMAEGRGKAQAATLRKTRAETSANVRLPDGSIVEKASSRSAGRRPVRRDRRRGDPRRRRHRRGHRHRRRVGDHRRVGSGHPRVRRRPVGGHRRHPGAERRDRRADHRQARRDVPRPDDRPRRGRRPPEDAQRDRADDPARRADDHLPARRGHAAAVRHLLRRRTERHRADRPPRVPHPDDHRRSAVVDRHRRHGPPGATQRAGDVGPRRRGRRRRHDAAARQDRHDHLRLAPGRRVHPGPRRRGDRARRGGDGVVARRRDTRGPLDRRARRSSSSPRLRSTTEAPTLVPFTAQTRMSGMDLSNGRQVRKGAADSVRRFVETPTKATTPTSHSSCSPSSSRCPATVPHRWS